MKHRLFLVFFWSIVGYSQAQYTQSISVISDNDLYVSTINDKYYTNGMFFSHRSLTSKTSEKQLKKIVMWHIGHQMYTPYKSTITQVSQHDRPFAAYLFTSYGVDRVYEKSIFSTEFQIGVLGPNALGKELQNTIHDLYNYDRPVGWEYQIKNAFGLQFNTSYTKHIGFSKTKYSDINLQSNLKLGTIFTEISTGFFGRFGFTPLEELSNSIAFNTNLNATNTNKNRTAEVFLYYKPTISYVLYDATIQGGLFKDRSPVTFPVNAIRFDLEFGLQFTYHRFNFGYAIHYYTNKLKGLRYPNGSTYGRIQLQYLIK